MTTIPAAIDPEALAVSPIRAQAPGRHALARMRDALLRRVRGLAWRVLDLETEFEALD